MTMDEIVDYWMPAQVYLVEHDRADLLSPSLGVAELLGLEEDVRNIELTPELKRKLECLVGPYGWAFIKILELRKENVTG
jgi:hypothetical protein